MDALRRRTLHRRQKNDGGLLDSILDNPHASSSSAALSASARSSAAASSTRASSSVLPSTTPTPAATSSPSPPQFVTVAGQTRVVTASSDFTSSALPSASATAAAAPTAFLDNKVLSGVVFTIVALVGFFLIVFIGTFFIRRRRNKQLVDEAVAFDPSSVPNYEDPEKTRISSSVGHGSSVGQAPEIKNAPPAFDQYVPPVPYLPPNVQHGHSPYTNPAASQSQTFVAPESWGSPPPQNSQPTIVVNNTRPSSDDGNHRQVVHHSSSSSSSGEMRFAPTVPPDMRRYYDNK